MQDLPISRQRSRNQESHSVRGGSVKWYLQYEFRGVFKHVVFAIPDAAGKNYRVFKREIADLHDTLIIEKWQNEVNFGNE